MNDPKNLLQADAELPGESLQCRLGIEVELPDLPHLIIGQLRHPVPTSFRPLHPVIPALPSAVRIVMQLRAEEQVIGPHASGYVAMVANQQSIGDRAEVQLPRHAMRSYCFSVLPAGIDEAMPEVGCRSGPQPASFGFVHEFPKPSLQRNAVDSHAS